MKKKKGIIIAIISILAVVIIALFALFIIKEREKNNKLMQINEYKENATEFANDVFYSLVSLETVGNQIKTYWYDHIYEKKYDSIDDAVSKALEDNDKLVNSIKNDKATIDANYKELLKLPIENDSELIEIKDAIKNLYDNYYDFYDIVITVSGNYSTFSNEFADIDGSAVKVYNSLKLLLEE